MSTYKINPLTAKYNYIRFLWNRCYWKLNEHLNL